MGHRRQAERKDFDELPIRNSTEQVAETIEVMQSIPTQANTARIGKTGKRRLAERNTIGSISRKCPQCLKEKAFIVNNARRMKCKDCGHEIIAKGNFYKLIIR